MLACLSQPPRVRPASWRHLARPEAPSRLSLAGRWRVRRCCRRAARPRDATLVLKTYGHLLPDSADRTRRAIDAAWSTSDGPQTAQAPSL